MTNHTNQKYDQTAKPIHSTAQQEQQQVQSQVPPSDTIKNSPPTSPNAREDLNKPISDNKRVPDMNESDDHVVATGAGTVGGAAVGAVAGLVGGPPGALVGGLIGGVLGGIAGADIAEGDHPEEDQYWREQYKHTPYYEQSQRTYGELDYDRDYREAYRLGYRNHHDASHTFNDAETDLRTEWEKVKGESCLTWEEAKFAVKDAWDRLKR